MKTQIILFISIVIITNVCKSQQKPNNNNTSYVGFTTEESIYLNGLVDFFDNYLISKTKINNIDSAYHSFMESLRFNNSLEDFWEKSNIPIEKTDSIITFFNRKNLFKMIWSYDFSERKNSTDTLFVSLAYNPNWKYGTFLKDLCDENYFIIEYIDNCMSAGGAIPPSLMAGFQNIHSQFDFTKRKWRLFIAMHYITFNYNVIYVKEAKTIRE